MIKIESVRESSGPISGSPVGGAGILFTLQGTITFSDSPQDSEGYFHAVPLDVFSELVLTQGFSAGDVVGMARHVLVGSGSPEKVNGGPPQDPDPDLLKLREAEREAVSQRLRERQGMRPALKNTLSGQDEPYWEEVADIARFLTGQYQDDVLGLNDPDRDVRSAYREKWGLQANRGQNLDETSPGWLTFLSRVEELRPQVDKGIEALVHQRHGDRILRSLTGKETYPDQIPLPPPAPDPRISPTGREPDAEEDGAT